MTAQIEFLATADDEAVLTDYLAKPPAIALPVSITFAPTPIMRLDLSARPSEGTPWAFYLWLPAAGDLHWYEERPALRESGHREFVLSILAAEQWDRTSASGVTHLLDTAHSPVQVYRRGSCVDGSVHPSLLLAPPANLETVAPDYARWVNRTHAWIRKHAIRVHSWREPSKDIANSLRLMNTVYAFPEALELIQSKQHHFVIS